MNAPNRNLAIIRYIRNQNHTVTEASRHFKISRQWIYTLLNRYDEGGEEAVKPRSKAPKANPQAIPEALRKDIVNMRKQLTKSGLDAGPDTIASDRKSTRLNSSHVSISYAVFCLTQK